MVDFVNSSIAHPERTHPNLPPLPFRQEPALTLPIQLAPIQLAPIQLAPLKLTPLELAGNVHLDPISGIVPHLRQPTLCSSSYRTNTVVAISAATALVPSFCGASEVPSEPPSLSRLRRSAAQAPSPSPLKTVSDSYWCQSCSKSFKRREHLLRHLSTHNYETRIQCTFEGCRKWFTRPDNMKVHRKKDHRKTHQDANSNVARCIRKREARSMTSNNTSANKVTNATYTPDSRVPNTPRPAIQSLTNRRCKPSSPMFPCTFAFAGCTSSFPSTNEWKRHVASIHTCFNHWKCELTARCSSAETFSRKDLFLSHLKRMHLPGPDVPHEEQTNWFQKHVDDGKRTRRAAIQSVRCPVPECNISWEGETAWDERMNHVALHWKRGMKKGECNESEGGLLEWAVNEGVVVADGGSGWRLEGTSNTE